MGKYFTNHFLKRFDLSYRSVLFGKTWELCWWETRWLNFLKPLAYGGFQVGELAKFLLVRSCWTADTILARLRKISEGNFESSLYKSEECFDRWSWVSLKIFLWELTFYREIRTVLKLYEVKSKKWSTQKILDDTWWWNILSSKWLEQLYV